MNPSIVVITRNHSERLEATLAAISSAVSGIELILVCDGAKVREHRSAALRRQFEALAMVALPGRGRAAARNAGAAAASGDPLVFLDGDMVFEPAALARLIGAPAGGDTLRRGAVLELLGAAVAPSLATGGPGFPPLKPETLRDKGFYPGGYRQGRSLLEQAVARRFDEGDIRIPAWIAAAGAFFSVCVPLWRAVGGQEESFGPAWGCEDLEFSHRVLRAGGEIAYVPEAIGYHLSHGQPGRWQRHAEALVHFEKVTGDASVRALSALLSPRGSLDAYLAELHERKTELPGWASRSPSSVARVRSAARKRSVLPKSAAI